MRLTYNEMDHIQKRNCLDAADRYIKAMQSSDPNVKAVVYSHIRNGIVDMIVTDNAVTHNFYDATINEHGLVTNVIKP